MEYIVWKLEGSTITKVTNNSPVKGTNNAYAECLYGAWGTDSVKVNFLPQRFYDLNGVNPVVGMKMYQETDQEIINAIVPESEQEANYGLWYFPMLKGITSILTSHNQSKYKISFERVALEDDDEYIGEYATASTVSAMINSELLFEFASAVENQYVNVYLTTTNVYASYLFDGTEWVAQSSVLNESIIDRTQPAEEIFKGTVFGNEDYTSEYDPSELANVLNGIYAEFADLNNTISNVNDALANYMLTEEYDSESGIASKAVKYATNLKGDSTFITSQSVIEHIINVSNPHGVTKAQLGLGNVDNTSDADKPISNAQAAVNAIKADLVGGVVPADQLPSYVDDVIEVATYADLPATGESGKIYVVIADETSGGNTSTYRWATSVYVMISNELSASEVKTLYESNTNTNAYTDTEKSIVAVAQENVIETVKVNGVAESVTSKSVDIDVPTKTSELINDGDGTTNFVTAEQLGDAGYGDMTKAEFNTNGAPGVVDKAVVAEELETNAVNDLPYIGDSAWDTPKNGVPTAIGKDNVVMPDVEGLTFEQIVNGDFPTDIGEWNSTGVTVSEVSGVTRITADISGSSLGINNYILNVGTSYVIKIKVKSPTNSVMRIGSTGSFTDYSLVSDTWKTISIKQTAVDEPFRIYKATENSGDYFEIDYAMAIPIPTKLSSLTDLQILKFFNGASYIPKGLHGIKDLKIVSTDVNGDTTTYELDTPMYSNDTRDLQGDATIEGVAIGATINDTLLPLIKASSTFYAQDEVNGDTQVGTVGDTLTLTNTAKVIYELATPLPRTEENDNLLVERGALLVSEYGSYTQGDQYGVKTEFNAKSALDLVKQVQLGVDIDVAQEKKLIAIDEHICGTHEAIQILQLTAAKINPATSKPDYDYASQSYLFPQNDTTERLYAVLPSPNDWVIGTPIRIQAHITQEDSGQAVMKVDYKLFEAFGATIPASATTYTMDTYVDDSYVSGSMSNGLRDGVEIDTSHITTRAFIRLEIYRDDNAYSGDLKVDDVAIFYTAYNCCDCSTVE